MDFTRFQVVLITIALGLAALVLSQVMTVGLQALKADMLGEQPSE
jgi:hypothetical protein